MSKKKPQPSKPSKIRPPTKSVTETLPFKDLGDYPFEEFCRRLCELQFADLESFELKRSRGNEQFGVDVECFDVNHDPVIVLSAKCYDKTNVTPEKISNWVQDFTKHLADHWQGKNVGTFILAITKDGNKDTVNAEIKNQKASLCAQGIKFEVWFNNHMQKICRENSDLVIEIFGVEWATKLFSHFTLQLLDNRRGGTPTMPNSELEILNSDLLNSLSASFFSQLNDLVAVRRRGNSSRLSDFLNERLSAKAEFEALSSDFKAALYRQQCSIHLDDNNFEKAEEFLELATSQADMPDRCLNALMAYRRDGAKKGIELLSGDLSQSEIELKAALLISLSDEETAKKEIAKGVETYFTAYLLGIIEFLEGDFEAAKTQAEFSLWLQPKNFASTNLLIRSYLAMAMAPGAGRNLGSEANLFSLSMVQETDQALAYLEKASVLARALVDQSQGSHRAEAEAWLVALLLCTSKTKQEGRELVAEFASRNLADPLHVVWAVYCDAELSVGAIRKRFLDLVRTGKGDPSHLVALVYLNLKEGKSNEDAVAVISKHRKRFPDDQEFIDKWLAEFSSPLKTLMESAMSGDKAAANTLVQEFAKRTEGSQDGLVLSIAEALSVGAHWEALNGLKDKLIALKVPKAVQLAASAAMNLENAQAVISIIDNAETVFKDGRVPSYLQAMKARALELEGQPVPALFTLRALSDASSEPDYTRQYIHGLQIRGKLAEAAVEARKFALSNTATPNDRVIAAELNRSHNPEFTLEMFEGLIEEGSLPESAVPCVWYGTGLKRSIREDLQAKLSGKAKSFLESDNVLRFESFEELIDFHEKRKQKIHDVRTQWERGQLPIHIAFSNAHQQLFELLLVGSKGLVSDIGERHFPIHTTAGFSKKTPVDHSVANPKLALDVTALVLAHRFNLIELLEGNFSIHVPRQLHGILSETLSGWSVSLGQEAISSFEVVKESLLKSIVLIEDAVEAPTSVVFHDGKIPANLKAVLDVMKQSGGFEQKSVENLLDLLGLKNWNPDKATSQMPEVITISGDLLMRLVVSQTFFDLALLVRIEMKRADWLELLERVATAKFSLRSKKSIENLAQTLQTKIDGEPWFWTPISLATLGSSNRQVEEPLFDALTDTMRFAELASNNFSWIEDRFLSRYNSERYLCFQDVLNLMVMRKSVSQREAKNISDQVLKDGLGFTPVDPNELISALKDSCKEGQGFSETPELRRLKEAFGKQASLLPLLDYNDQRQGADGRREGEVRHGYNLAILLSKILAEIWQSGSFSEKQQIDCSNWCWTYFRLDSIRPHEDSDLSDAQLLVMTATIIHTLATLPFGVALDPERPQIEEFEGYLNWLFGHHLIARFSIDPALANAFEECVANLMFNSNILPNTEEDHVRILRSIQIDLARRLLSLFPDNLSQGIFLKGKKLWPEIGGFKATLNLEPGSVGVAELATSLAQMEPGKTPTLLVPLEGSDETIEFEVEEKDGACKALVFKSSEGTIKIADELLMHVLPRSQDRIEAFERLTLKNHHSESWFERVRESLREDEELEGRIDVWENHKATSFYQTLLSIEEEASSRSQMRRDDFKLPPSWVLLEHLELSGDETDPEQSLETSYLALKGRFGASEAQKRLLMVYWLSGQIQRFEHPITEGLSVFAELAMSSRSGSEISDETKSLIADFSFLFPRMVRLAAEQMLVEPSYDDLPSWLQVILCWTWASQIAQVLLHYGAEPKSTANAIEQQRTRGLQHSLYFRNPDYVFQNSALRMSPDWVEYRVFEAFYPVCKTDLYENKKHWLFDLAGVYEGETYWPAALAFGSQQADYWPMQPLVTAADLADLPALEIDQRLLDLVNGSLPDLDDDPKKNVDILLYIYSRKIGALNDRQEEGLLDYFARTLVKLDHNSFKGGSTWLFEHFGSLCGTRYSINVLIETLTAIVAGSFPNRSPKTLNSIQVNSVSNRLFVDLVEAHISFIRQAKVSDKQKIVLLDNAVRHLWLVWPKSHGALHELVSRFVDVLPTNSARYLWPLLRELRSRDRPY